jgi:hypothetical protein
VQGEQFVEYHVPEPVQQQNQKNKRHSKFDEVEDVDFVV